MKSRLSLEERNELAFKLRSDILAVEAPERLEVLSNQEFQPHHLAVGIYAFEYFLDRYRNKFRNEGVEETLGYNIGWSGGSLRRDEEPQRPDRVVRMAASLFMVTLEERGDIEKITSIWFERFLGVGTAYGSDQLKGFLYEVLYELALEFTGELYRTLK